MARLLANDSLIGSQVPSNCGMWMLTEFKGGHRHPPSDFVLTDAEWAAVLQKAQYYGHRPLLFTATESQHDNWLNGVCVKGLVEFLNKHNCKVTATKTSYYYVYVADPSPELSRMLGTDYMSSEYQKTQFDKPKVATAAVGGREAQAVEGRQGIAAAAQGLADALDRAAEAAARRGNRPMYWDAAGRRWV